MVAIGSGVGSCSRRGYIAAPAEGSRQPELGKRHCLHCKESIRRGGIPVWTGQVCLPLPLPPPPNVSCSIPSQVCMDKEDTFSNAIKIAEDIASKSPVAVQGSKINMNYSRDHTVDEGLHFAVSLLHCLYSRPHYCFCSVLQVVWNSTMLQSEDVGKAIMAAIQKEKAIFSKL